MIFKTINPDLIIKSATRKDAKLIVSFIKKLAKYEKLSLKVSVTETKIINSIFIRKEAEVLIAYLNGKPVGFALFYKSYSTFLGQANLYLEDIFVDENMRNIGIGKAFFKVLSQFAKSRGYQRFEWSCLKWNKPSLAFYKKLGAKTMDDWLIHRLTPKEYNKLI
jgi:GNAT superfamily N-acetyltransferase